MVSLEYNSATFSKAIRTDIVALRLISGAMRTPPTRPCDIEFKMAPLDIRRDAAIVTTDERYLDAWKLSKQNADWYVGGKEDTGCTTVTSKRGRYLTPWQQLHRLSSTDLFIY